MRPITCHAGYPLPIALGKMEICGISAVVNNPTLDARITIIDDMSLPRNAVTGRILADEDQKMPFIDIKGMADIDGVLMEFFPEPVKLNYGASVINATNLKGGRIMLFTR